MANSSHDTLVYRLAQILIKLNQGEKLDPQCLADEFGVNLRTIQRDLNVRFAYLPLQRTDGRYYLDPVFLGKLNNRDIERFACLAGVRGLFPSFSDDFLRDIFDGSMQAALLVRGHNYEDLAGREDDFRLLERAIVSRQRVAFDYRKKNEAKSYADIEPYKMINHKGIWYLAANDKDHLKAFAFGRISSLRSLDVNFSHDPSIERRLIEEDGIWLGDKKEVVFKVSREIAGYFKRRKLIANQIIEKDLEEGGLIVSARVSHFNEVLPIVRYWIPHIRIISPEGLQDELERDLRAYVERNASLLGEQRVSPGP